MIKLLLLSIGLTSCAAQSALVTSQETFYKFENVDEETYRIVWGNKKINNVSSGEFKVQGNGRLGLQTQNEKAIVLSQSCGTSCNYYVVLPMEKGSSEKIFELVVAFDSLQNLIAYIPSLTDYLNIRVVNYLNGKTMDVLETNLCPAASKNDCIDECYFEKGKLVLKWQGSKWKNWNLKDPQIKEIPLKLE